MAGVRNMQQGIQAIQEGNAGEGARLLRIALQDSSLTGSMRATACIWLAETDPNPPFKIQCYNDALAADPGNPHAQQRLDLILSNSLPPVSNLSTSTGTQTVVTVPTSAQSFLPTQPVQSFQPAQTQPAQQQPQPQPRQTALFYRTIGIIDGPNGKGTGFFVTTDGMIATTRLVVSGMENVVISLEPGRQIVGKVVRSYPELDLAFIQIELNLTHILPFSTMSNLPDNLEITAITHDGQLIRGRCRATKRDIKPQWFPTTIRQLADAGGDPVFDDHNYVIGMLTRNASRSSTDVFGLHIGVIKTQLEAYRQEIQLDPNRAYCPACGYVSRSQNFGAFYCETCGSILPATRGVNRFPVPQAATLYGENLQRPCRHCTSRAGYYNGRCLRCGNDM
ncbi:MAG TPA: serine protease [Phototrophicaceae bacterium]|jgi:hypothetical protein|nr:serine protease [Phototrophicaceae bacterium]